MKLLINTAIETRSFFMLRPLKGRLFNEAILRESGIDQH
jgi:hypothetical protein